MEKPSIIGLDLAKRSFQAHGAHADGGVAFRKKLSREASTGLPPDIVIPNSCRFMRIAGWSVSRTSTS